MNKRRLLFLLAALLFVCPLSHAQLGFVSRSFSTSAVAADIGVNESGMGITSHRISWSGSVSPLTTCTVEADQAPDNATWTVLIAGQSCVTGGSSVFTTATNSFIRINVTVISGGTVTVAYTGYIVSPASGAGGSVSITNTPGSTDPCQNPAVLKLSAFLNISTASTTQIIAITASTIDYICEFDVNMVATVAADTVLFEQGTGTNCAANVAVISPTYSSGILTNGAVNVNVGSGGATIMASVVASREICVVSTVGTGPTIAVHVSYVQQ